MDINLDGAEKSIIKAIGFGGAGIKGSTLIERVGDLEEAELIDTIRGLMSIGYLIADKQSFHEIRDVENTEFNINSGYSRELKDSLDPRASQVPKKSRRVRRE